MAKPEFDVVVIGGGAGGLVVAAGGAALGAKVALVEKHRLGGDCLWTGCVPSKALLACARVAHEMRTAARWGLAPVEPRPDIATVMAHVAAVVAEIAPHDSPERFRDLGVDVILAEGAFASPRAFAAAGRQLTARAFVIATGSRPMIPDIPGLEAVPHLTNETVFDLREPVPSLAVIGAGPVGCELAQAFARLGSRVTLVEAGPQILPREDADLALEVAGALEAEGIELMLAAQARKVNGARGNIAVDVARQDTTSTIRVAQLLVAAGRTPNLAGLALDRAHVRTANGRLVLDGGLRTTNPRVYAIGDAAGGQQFTHLAEHHAGIVLRRALFRMHRARPSKVVPWCTYTDPELARVGLSEAEARASGIRHEVHRFAVAENDRARTDRAARGMAKLVTTPRGRILGAAIAGPHAAELIAEYALAIQHRLSAADISATMHPYPSWSQTNRRVADQRRNAALTPSRRVWLKRILALRGT